MLKLQSVYVSACVSQWFVTFKSKWSIHVLWPDASIDRIKEARKHFILSRRTNPSRRSGRVLLEERMGYPWMRRSVQTTSPKPITSRKIKGRFTSRDISTLVFHQILFPFWHSAETEYSAIKLPIIRPDTYYSAIKLPIIRPIIWPNIYYSAEYLIIWPNTSLFGRIMWYSFEQQHSARH